jgi:hypothetical protein
MLDDSSSVSTRGGVHDALEIGEAGAVIEFEERKTFRVAPGADPGFEDDGIFWFGGGKDVLDQGAHNEWGKCCAPGGGLTRKVFIHGYFSNGSVFFAANGIDMSD